jgi:HEAT repeat protein
LNSQYSEYDSADEENDWGPGNGLPISSTGNKQVIAVDDLLNRLIRERSMPDAEQLYALSDLSRTDAQTVETRWSQIPLDIRRALVEQLVTAAEEDIRMHLGRILRIALDDDDAQIRRRAIEGLWEETSDDLIGSFTYMLRQDPSSEVRAAAAGALGSFVLAGELDELEASLAMRAEESLLDVLRNELEPIQVQCRALESIAYSGEVGVRQLIEDAYYSPYEEMRISALNAMGRSADIRWRGLARAELENPSPEMRVGAAIACGELEAHAAVHDMIALLNDEEQAVRLAAVFALGRLGGKAAQEALRAVAASEFEVEAEAAEQALEEMLFYGSADEIPLFDESDVEEEWDDEPWDGWFGRDNSDLGSYG